MTKYINAEKLIAYIERRKNESRELAQEHKDSSLGNAAQTMANEDEEILSFITSLQQEQPEVDLEKEIRLYQMNHNIISHGENGLNMYMASVARHFYELGLNARKEE